MKKIAAFMVVFIVGTWFVQPAFAQKRSWVEMLFPRYKDVGPDPAETLQAPFAIDPDDKADGEKSEAARLPENDIPLHMPHRNSAYISQWMVTAISETLTFDGEDGQAAIAALDPYFTSEGKQQYVEFLKASEMMKVLQSNKFQVRSFVRETPLLLNEGAVGGRYKWLYEIPVMVSYLEKGVVNYKNAEPVNQEVRLTVQVGRSNDAQTEDAIVIERWAGKAESIKRK